MKNEKKESVEHLTELAKEEVEMKWLRKPEKKE